MLCIKDLAQTIHYEIALLTNKREINIAVLLFNHFRNSMCCLPVSSHNKMKEFIIVAESKSLVDVVWLLSMSEVTICIPAMLPINTVFTQG